MHVLKVTKGISFDRMNDVKRYNDIDVSFLRADKKNHSSTKKKRVKQSNGLKMH